eukprot:TRINITY_DN10355_c0_g1_i2.p1 TRINITY_DN10355_c0_g1~~TRINITY_DN10355_c0_g1_i2.p1  ORF type:complete len:421 (+),score=41.91 TRINITY_DN10355_c0_g1_i2:315-1577(+)
MWLNQLTQDRDVIGQYEAAKGLEDHQTESAARALAACVENNRVFYKIRCEAALSMACSANRDTNHLVLQLLTRYFRTIFYDPTLGRVRPNDFTEFSQYLLQQGLVRAISRIQIDKEGHTHSEALAFILSLLKDNDNSFNKFSDYAYLGCLISALGNTNTAGINDTDKIMKQLNRYLKFDKMSPAYHNVTTVHCLRAICNMQARKTLPVDLAIFKPYTVYGYYRKVRTEAVKSLVRLGYHSFELLLELLDMAERDPCPVFRRKVLRLMMIPSVQQIASTQQAQAFMEQLWTMLNTRITGTDSLFRDKAWDLYHYLWGSAHPSCAAPLSRPPLLDMIAARTSSLDSATIRELTESTKRKRDGDGYAEEKKGAAQLVGVAGRIKIPRTALETSPHQAAASNPATTTTTATSLKVKLKLPSKPL